MRIIAHRCRGFGHLENTEAALLAALASGVDEVELDLQLVQDGELVVWHDLHISLLTGEKVALRNVSLDDAEKHGVMSCARLLELFKKHGKGKRLNIDIKKHGGEAQLVSLIRRYKLEKRVIIVSWIGKSLEEIHGLAPSLALSYSFTPKFHNGHGNGKPCRPALWLPRVLTRLPIETVNLVLGPLPLSRSLVRRLETLGVEVVVCNADTIEKNERLLAKGVTGTMTNNSLELLAWRER
jgi:glycerophosphoryl diester phosphodiesterase